MVSLPLQVSLEVQLQLQFFRWDECDTVGKKIGFIVGKVINFVGTIFAKLLGLGNSLLFNDFTARLWQGFSDNVLSPVLKRLANLASLIYQRVIEPILNKFPSKATVGSHSSDRAVENCSRCLNGLGRIFVPIWNWTVVPLYDYVLSPLGTVVDDVFHGIISGSLCTDPSANDAALRMMLEENLRGVEEHEHND